MLLFGSGYDVYTYQYDAPTRPTLRARLAVLLADVAQNVFNDDILDMLISSALVEVSSVYPKEVREVFDLFDDLFSYTPASTHVFRVEIVDATTDLPKWLVDGNHGSDDSSSGWDLHGGTLYLPPTLSFDEDTDRLSVWGYAPRDALQDDDTPADIDQQAEQALLAYGQLQGYQMLSENRAMFTQWNTQPGNSDVSLPQLIGLLQVYDQRWTTQRKRLRLLQRA